MRFLPTLKRTLESLQICVRLFSGLGLQYIPYRIVRGLRLGVYRGISIQENFVDTRQQWSLLENVKLQLIFLHLSNSSLRNLELSSYFSNRSPRILVHSRSDDIPESWYKNTAWNICLFSILLVSLSCFIVPQKKNRPIFRYFSILKISCCAFSARWTSITRDLCAFKSISPKLWDSMN